MRMLQEDQEPVDNRPELPFSLFPSNSLMPKKNTKVLETRKKILLISEHCHQYTNNSKISWNLLKIMANNPNLDVFHFGTNQSDTTAVNFRPYPENVSYVSVKEVSDDPYGSDELKKYIDAVNPDHIVIFNTPENIAHYIELIEVGRKITAYVEMLYYHISNTVVTSLNKADRIYVTSAFWKTALEENDITKPIFVMNCGFDSLLMPKLDKTETRIKTGLPTSAFIIMSPSKNLQNYRYDIILKAYIKLLAKYPKKDIRLFCLCDKDEAGGYSILDIYKQEIKNNKLNIHSQISKIMLVQQSQIINDDVKNCLFNCADIGLLCPENDGLNMDSFEMMGVGIPQVVPKSGQFEEYCNEDNSLLVPISNIYYHSNSLRTMLTEARAVSADDVFLALEKYMLNPELLAEHKTNSMAKVKKYTWSYVTTDFINYLVKP